MMEIEVYVVAQRDSNEFGPEDIFGPYGYPSQVTAYEAARAAAMACKGQVLAYSFTFADSELVDDFTEDD